MEAMVILAHGSKREDTKIVLNTLIEKVKQKTGWTKVLPAYLQLCEPGLETVIEQLASENVNDITIMPLFLFNGEHVTKDIPEMLDGLRNKYPLMRMTLKKYVGTDDRIADIIIDRIKE